MKSCRHANKKIENERNRLQDRNRLACDLEKQARPTDRGRLACNLPKGKPKVVSLKIHLSR
jgi:hypothetical protein